MPGCPLANVAAGTINCTCHGSQFSITRRQQRHRAERDRRGLVPGLAKVAVKVQGADVVQG